MILGQGANGAFPADRKAVRMTREQALVQLCLWWRERPGHEKKET